MDRRTFLKATGVVVGALGSGGLLAACGQGAGSPVPDGPPGLNLISASYPELLVGERRRFAFTITTLDNTPVERDDVDVYTRDADGEITGGPYEVERFAPEGIGAPIYRAFVDVPTGGIVELVAVSEGEFGTQAMQAVEPAASAIPTPGSQAISTQTPTIDDDQGVVELCTLGEDCAMHDVSLDDALAEGRPVMLMFATPAYCQTAVCGPGVETLEAVRQSGDWGDVAFIHAEIFSDRGETVAAHVLDWDLPSEPWLFTIDSDGAIAARVDGPMISEELSELASGIV